MPSFDAVDAAVINVFGEDITYTPDGGAPTVIKAFFQSPDTLPESGVDINFESIGPQVYVKDADVPSPGHLDTVTVRGIVYTVKQVERDESSLRILHLLEQV